MIIKNFKTTLLLAVFVFTASFGYAQNTTNPKTQKDSTKSISEPTIYVGNSILGGKQTRETLLENPFLSVISKDGIEWNGMLCLIELHLLE
jgi:hypothetical protein